MRLPKFWLKFGSPKWFTAFSIRFARLLRVLAVLFLTVGAIWGLFFAPADYQQKDAFRIIYVHVPSAFLSMFIFASMGIQSLVFLVWRIKLADIMAKVSAPLGASFTVLALLTGALWGKPMWGTYWIWDARLTSELILLLLYVAYIGVYSAFPQPQAGRIAAYFALAGTLDLPIIHYSVEWWSTLHQGATLSKFAKPSMAPQMLYPLTLMLVGFFLVYGFVLLTKGRQELELRQKSGLC